MNLSLTIDFDSLEDMQNFISGRTSQHPASIIAPDLTEQTMAAADATVVDINPVVEETALEGVLEPAVDLVALRKEIHGTITAKAQSMTDPSILGAFITGFGVKKFSELDDDMLEPFKAAFVAEFGA